MRLLQTCPYFTLSKARRTFFFQKTYVPATFKFLKKIYYVAEGTGFEPARAYHPLVFETNAIDHSANPPIENILPPDLQHETILHTVSPTGFEPIPQPSQGRVLSIRLRGLQVHLQFFLKRTMHIPAIHPSDLHYYI